MLSNYIFTIIVSAKFVYGADVDALVNPTEETERFIEGVALILGNLNKMAVEPPLYKIYQNKLYRDYKKAFKVTNAVLLSLIRNDW